MSKLKRRTFIKTAAAAAAASIVPLRAHRIEFKNSAELDILIKNGMIIDGNASKEFAADLGIKNGLIDSIGNLNEVKAKLVIDAKNLKVAPGFIDFHSHTDLDLLLNPKAESKIRQGVTTEITGQDGFSVAPIGGFLLDKTLENFLNDYHEILQWRTMGEFFDNFSSRCFGINLASMIGLGTVREVVVGYDDRPATGEELSRMKYEVARAIEEGAIGLSTGLEYTPGSFASTEELIELCNAAPLKGRIYSTHMRNEDNTVLEAIEEAIRIAKESDSRLQLAHLKVSGKSNWHKADAVLEKIDSAVKSGLDVHADRYTYVAYHTNLSSLFPLWSRDGGDDKFISRLNDKSLMKEIRAYAEKKVSNLDGEWNGVLISFVGKNEFKSYQGKTIQKISEELSMPAFDACVKVILDADNNVMMMGFGMEESSTEKILAHPRVMISSDAGSHAPYPPMNGRIAHPRAYGTFPRAIAKYVRERKICSLEEMIKKMTSMPADKLQIKDRGRLEKGKSADVVIFDFNTIQDKAEFTDSHQFPEGIPHVIVNGKSVIYDNNHTGNLPGKIIKG